MEKKTFEFTSFNCTRMAGTDQTNPDEWHALAFADINGHKSCETQEDGESDTLVCRVWLLNERDGIYARYLVDWHIDKYRENKKAVDCVNKVKDELRAHFKTIVRHLADVAYDRYKLRWLSDHGYSLYDLLKKLGEQLEGQSAQSLYDALTKFEEKGGFGDKEEIWSSYANFLAFEWDDEEYMEKLLLEEERDIWKRRDWF